MLDREFGIYGDNEFCDEACQLYYDELEKSLIEKYENNTIAADKQDFQNEH